MQSTEIDRPSELGWKDFLRQYNIFTDSTMVVQNLQRVGRKTYDVAIEYGPVYVQILSNNLSNVVNFVSLPPLKEMALAFENLTKSRTEHVYLIGHVFFEGHFGRFIMKSLDVCTYSFERLLKRLELLTKDTVIVFPSESHPPLETLNKINNDTTVESSLPNTESSEPLQPVPKIEPSTHLDNTALPHEKAESPTQASELEPEKDTLAEFMLLSNRTIVYENVTGLEKWFVLMFSAFILCPVNAAVALLRFLRIMLRDFEECVYASQMNVTTSGRRVKIASLLNGTILMNRLKTLYLILVQPNLEDSVTRLEYKNYLGLSGSNDEFLHKEMDHVNFYWEENDSDYEPMDKNSDTCTTESSESDVEISTYEVNPIKIEVKSEESKDKAV